MFMFGCAADEETYPPSQKSYHQQGNTSHFCLILISKRHIVHQLASAMIQGVLTEEVSWSCYLQNDSSPHVLRDFHDILEIPGAIFVLTVSQLQDRCVSFILLIKCRGRNLIHASMRYKWETYLILRNLSVEIGKLLYLFIFTGLLSAATKVQNEARAWPIPKNVMNRLI